jgi:tetratricopeptide (TPR) repeat protein
MSGSSFAQPSGPELGGPEAASLKQEATRGDLRGLRQLLSETRQKRDWQDRYFMIDLVAPSCLHNALNAACASEPNAADLFLLRGAYLTHLAWKGRGAHIARKTPEINIATAASNVQAALPDLKKAISLAPDDPVPYVFAMNAMRIFNADHEQLAKAYGKAISLAPDFLQAHWSMITAKSKKWVGSHETRPKLGRAVTCSQLCSMRIFLCGSIPLSSTRT